MSGEHRGASRFRARFTAVFKNVKTGKGLRALTNDISATGMSLVADELLSPGTPLEVKLKLPDRETPLTLQAEVVRSKVIGGPHKSSEPPTAETAIRFLNLSRDDHAVIKHFTSVYGLPW